MTGSSFQRALQCAALLAASASAFEGPERLRLVRSEEAGGARLAPGGAGPGPAPRGAPGSRRPQAVALVSAAGLVAVDLRAAAPPLAPAAPEAAVAAEEQQRPAAPAVPPLGTPAAGPAPAAAAPAAASAAVGAAAAAGAARPAGPAGAAAAEQPGLAAGAAVGAAAAAGAARPVGAAEAAAAEQPGLAAAGPASRAAAQEAPAGASAGSSASEPAAAGAAAPAAVAMAVAPAAASAAGAAGAAGSAGASAAPGAAAPAHGAASPAPRVDAELVLAQVILALSLVATLVGLVVWRVAGAGGASPSAAPPPWPRSLQWMVTLTVSTACLLSVQLLLAISIGSLALLADSAHGAADFASYTLTSFVEYLKFRFGARAINARAAVQLDRASAGFSVLIVMATSVCVCAQAVGRLRAAEQVREEGLGSAMLVVASLGMALNGGMLGLKAWMNSQPSVCPPCPPAGVPKGTSGTPEDGSLDARAKRLLGARGGPPGCPPCQPSGARECPSPRPDAGAPGAQPRQPTGSGAELQVGLHEALHPGCRGGPCAARARNLNVAGVVLHVGSDVARTLLMFIAGALLRAGLLSSTAAVDAACSCLLAGCAALGCAWVLGEACGPLEGPTAKPRGRGAAGAAP